MKAWQIAAAGSLIMAAGFAWLVAYPVAASPVQTAVVVADNPPTTVISELEAWAETQSISLTEQQAEEVADGCRDFINLEVNRALEQSRSSRGKYAQLASTLVLSLDFVINNLAQMAQDGTVTKALRQSIVGLETSFLTAITAYDLSLRNLLSIADNCGDHPEAFVAGLRIAHDQRQATTAAAQAILDFGGRDFRDELWRIRVRAAEEN